MCNKEFLLVMPT